MILGLAPAAFGQSFAPVRVYTAADVFSKVNGVAVADLNGDMRPDLVASCEAEPVVGVLLNRGAGTFAPTLLNFSRRNTALGGVAVADVNADGQPDIVTDAFSEVLVLLGHGDGTFAPVVAYPTGRNTNPVGLAVVDVSGDGQLDIVAADSYTGAVQVLLGSGNGTFAPAAAYAAGTSSYAGGLAVADVNADGLLDVLTVDYGHGALQVLLGTGAGVFAAAAGYATGAGSYPTSLSVGDANGDGKLDVVVANSNFFGTQGAAGVFLGSGTGTFAPITTYATGPTSQPSGIALADVTGDGNLDIVTANNNPSNCTASLVVLPGTGTGLFQPGRFYYSGGPAGTCSGASGVTVADVSGDGKPDIIAANHVAGTVGVLLNTGAFLGTALPVLAGQLTLWPNPAACHAPVTLAATGLPTQARRVAATMLTVVGQPVGHVAVPVTQRMARVTLSTAGLTSGLYLLQVRAYDAQGSEVGTMSTQRLRLE